MSNIFLSVVIPCYDEMGNLHKGVLNKVQDFLKSKKSPFEVIIVDDGSTDGSVAFLERFIDRNKGFRLIKNKHTGKSGAVTTGMLEAQGEYVLFTDMDQATPIEEVDNLLPFVKEGYDIVIGSRNTKRRGSPWTRTLMSRGMMILRTLVVGIHGISDTQCGFKLFSRTAAQDLFAQIKKLHGGFRTVAGSRVSAGFDVELLFLAEKKGYKIKEAPVDWLYVETRRVNPIWDSLYAIEDLLRIRYNSIKGIYKEYL